MVGWAWDVFEPLLFGLIGAEIRVSKLEGLTVGETNTDTDTYTQNNTVRWLLSLREIQMWLYGCKCICIAKNKKKPQKSFISLCPVNIKTWVFVSSHVLYFQFPHEGSLGNILDFSQVAVIEAQLHIIALQKNFLRYDFKLRKAVRGNMIYVYELPDKSSINK